MGEIYYFCYSGLGDRIAGLCRAKIKYPDRLINFIWFRGTFITDYTKRYTDDTFLKYFSVGENINVIDTNLEQFKNLKEKITKDDIYIQELSSGIPSSDFLKTVVTLKDIITPTYETVVHVRMTDQLPNIKEIRDNPTKISDRYINAIMKLENKSLLVITDDFYTYTELKKRNFNVNYVDQVNVSLKATVYHLSIMSKSKTVYRTVGGFAQLGAALGENVKVIDL